MMSALALVARIIGRAGLWVLAYLASVVVAAFTILITGAGFRLITGGGYDDATLYELSSVPVWLVPAGVLVFLFALIPAFGVSAIPEAAGVAPSPRRYGLFGLAGGALTAALLFPEYLAGAAPSLPHWSEGFITGIVPYAVGGLLGGMTLGSLRRMTLNSRARRSGFLSTR